MHPFYGPSSELLSQGNSSWIGLASMILYLVFWAVVIIIAYRMVKKYFIKEYDSKVKEDTAMSILRERYARGEIDSKEFKEKKADLELK